MYTIIITAMFLTPEKRVGRSEGGREGKEKQNNLNIQTTG